MIDMIYMVDWVFCQCWF